MEQLQARANALCGPFVAVLAVPLALALLCLALGILARAVHWLALGIGAF
jgi:hypothetical protein